MSTDSRKKSTRNTKRSSSRTGRRRKKDNYTQIAVMVIFVVLVIIVAVWGIKKFKSSASTEDSTTTVVESELEKEVTVDGISITGMKQSEAKEAILKNYTWNMKAALSEDPSDTYALPNMLEPQLDKLLDEIYSDTAKDSYSLSFDDMDDAIATEVKAMADKWNVAAKNGAISGFDTNSGSFIYTGEQTGRAVDEEKLTKDLKSALSGKNFSQTITVDTKTVQPEITEAQAKEMYKVIGTYTTKTTSNNDRNTNIKLACAAIDGTILQPGEEFSFNNKTGNRTTEKGYKEAGAYVNGVVVTEPGGGVCQVSSTLYNAVIFSGLTTTERHAHTFEPSYVTPGEDAMVSYDGYAGPDMKFVNTSQSAIAIRAKYADQKLTMSIVGIPILEDGVTISMHSEKTAEYDPPVPEYEEDQTLQPGVEVVAKAGTTGSRWVTNIITKKDGAVVSDEFFHNSTYKGHAAIVRRNTSGVVIDPSGSDISSESDTTIETIDAVTGENVTEAPVEGINGGPGATKATTQAATTSATAPAQQPTAQAPTQAPTASAPTQNQPQQTVETIPPNPGVNQAP